MMTTNHDTKHEVLAERVLGRISSEHLTPRPRWEFLFKNYFFWGLGMLAVAFGALAVSAILFEITNVDWRLGSATHGGFWPLLLAAAPYLWVALLAVFVIVGYMNVRRTDGGYRYRLSTIAVGAVLTSLSLGSVLYLAGLGGAVEGAFGDHPSFYRPIILQEQSWWLAPEKGLLGGMVVAVAPDFSTFTLKDWNGVVQTVDADDLPARDRAVVARGGMVRIVGVPLTATSSEGALFHACFVFPFMMRGMFRDAPPPPPLATLASSSERESPREQSTECRGIRPYADLRPLDE